MNTILAGSIVYRLCNVNFMTLAFLFSHRLPTPPIHPQRPHPLIARSSLTKSLPTTIDTDLLKDQGTVSILTTTSTDAKDAIKALGKTRLCREIVAF
jgi:hypothetical protein